jgi:hypothetical protein
MTHIYQLGGDASGAGAGAAHVAGAEYGYVRAV